MNTALEKHMIDAHKAIRNVMDTHHCSMRIAAFALGVGRVKEATDLRGMG